VTASTILRSLSKRKNGDHSLNDGSMDNTEKIALDSLKKHSINGKVITNPRSGVNAAINRGTIETSNQIVVIAGADGLFDENTIPHLVSVLLSSDNIGAVSGDLVPVSKGESMFSKSEAAYRSIYAGYAHGKAMFIRLTVSTVRSLLSGKKQPLP